MKSIITFMTEDVVSRQAVLDVKMTNEKAIEILRELWRYEKVDYTDNEVREALDIAIAALKAEPCKDCVSRQTVLDKIKEVCFSKEQKWVDFRVSHGSSVQRYFIINFIESLPPVTPKQNLCKDCKWWKDSDGTYRRGIGAESRCPINSKKVLEGHGYCYLFEPKMEGEEDG